MVELARHSAGFASPPAGGYVLKIMPRCRNSYPDERDLRRAPSPFTTEGRQLEVAQPATLGLADKEIAHYQSVIKVPSKAPSR